MARPKVEVNEKRVLSLASNFATIPEIAADQGCSESTLSRRFDDTIKKGKELGRLSLRARQFQVAMGSDPKPAVYLRTHQDKDGNQYGELVYSPEGKPIMVSPAVPAKPPNVTMLIWLGKQELNQSDKFKLDDGDGFEFGK